ncbi:MAG: hypothetical protein K9H49_10535 [Bacteroidales bacterium]|nr:hypothetical protein [Bacteroidales bacterium]MCF8391074.1 hypothetical protein [Bacteroidales bacterium]
MLIQKGNIFSWKLIIFLVVMSGIFNFYLFPKYAVKYNDEKLIPLDLRSSYNCEEVVELFSKMGIEGRRNYQISAGIVDMIYPVIYGPLLVLLLSKIIDHIFKRKSYLKYLALLPLLAMLFDYSENMHILKMLAEYPDIKESTAFRSSVFSGFKWYLVSLIMVLVIAGTFISLVKFLIIKEKDKK